LIFVGYRLFLHNQVQGKMKKSSKNRASRPKYVSNNQLTLDGFESPFEKKLNPENRWVRLSNALPWDDLVSIYRKHFPEKEMGRPDLNPRLVLGAIIIKHMCDLDDRETVEQISENIYMQYFLGYSSFSDTVPFDASLFVEFRKRLGLEQINALNERILQTKLEMEGKKASNKKEDQTNNNEDSVSHKGSLIIDATACPQDIAFPTDLNLLNDAREKLEQLMDFVFDYSTLEQKPRNYREIARKEYLKVAQKKSKTRKDIRSSIRKQLAYVGRNISIVNKMLDHCETIPFDKSQYKYWFVIQHLYEQQKTMYVNKTHSVEDRIVSIHQPHVRPIVRGKSNAKVEFGAKINVSLVDGFSFLDDHSWDAYNEGTRLKDCVEKYKSRFGYYPLEVLVDKIYCTRVNRAYLKELGITLKAKPLGRPSKQALSNQVSPGERNPIEGKFGQAKTAYGLDRIKARLANTSESWVASIILVLNLVNLAELVQYCLKIILSKYLIIQQNIFFTEKYSNLSQIRV
jgi:transposase, IS5 family